MEIYVPGFKTCSLVVLLSYLPLYFTERFLQLWLSYDLELEAMRGEYW